MECEKAKSEIFHIGNEEEITIRELVIEAGNYFNFKGEYIDEKTYPGSVQRRCPDLTKAKSFFDYNVTIDWRIGLHKSLEWYKNYFLANQSKKFFKAPEELKIK